MEVLNIITIVCAGLLIGNEIAIPLFVNPALWKLEEKPQARATSLLAHTLGRVMPFWYGVTLVLLLAEAFLHRHRPALTPLLTAAVLWIAIVLLTALFLVPINKRVAALDPEALREGWQRAHRKWNTLHLWRILVLIVAFVCFLAGIFWPH